MLNSFAKYRDKNKLSWQDMADLCDLHVSQVGYILKMKPSDMERLTLGTAARIKLATGIDLFESVTDYVREAKKKQGAATPSGLPAKMAGGQVDETVAEQDATA